MKGKLWPLGLLCVALLLGSFPVREMWGSAASDIMRIAGFGALFFWAMARPRMK